MSVSCPATTTPTCRSSLPYLASTFAPWTQDDSGAPGFPYLRIRESVAIIGLSSAVPTAPLIASGRVGRAQFAAAADLLERAGRDGLIRVILIHHPPHRDGAKFGRTLSDAALFEAMIRRHGAELVLHGHNHRLSVTHIPGPDHQVPVIGVASASANHGTHDHRAGYNLFRIDGSQKKPRISGADARPAAGRARDRRSAADRALAFSGEVDAGSRYENAQIVQTAFGRKTGPHSF